MVVDLNKSSWKDPRIILILFLIIISPLLSKDDRPDEYKDLDPNTVVRVIDGDTIELASGEIVRYIGIDTPEINSIDNASECFAQQAKLKNEQLALGKVVTLKKDFSEKDKYGRLLRYVYVNNKFINLELVTQGYAHSVSFPPDVEQQSLFDKAEQMAMERREGLWSACEPEKT